MQKLILTTLLLATITGTSQSTRLEWVKSMGGTSIETGTYITSDEKGNVYTAGNFNNTIDFDPGPGVFNLSAVNDDDLFISKLDASGNFVWAKSIGSSAGVFPTSLCIDKLGNVYAGGLFNGIADFDPGAGKFNLKSFGYNQFVGYNNYDAFILKLDSSGNFNWAKQVGGKGIDVALNTKLDTMGNVYTTGQFTAIVDFDPDPLKTYNLTSASGANDTAKNDIFILKLDNAGNFIWVKSIGGPESDRLGSFLIDFSGNIYLSGNFKGTMDFDPGAGTYPLTSAGTSDIFTSKLNAAGNFIWAKRQLGLEPDSTYATVLDTAGNLYLWGMFLRTVDFDPGPGTFNLTSSGGYDVFVSKRDSSGKLIWAKKIDGINHEYNNAIQIDKLGNTFLAGSFVETVDFDPGAKSVFQTSEGWFDMFILKLNASGNFAWVKKSGGPDWDACYAMHIDKSGNIYATGQFHGTSDYDPGRGVFNLTSVGSGDIFIQKQSPGNCLESYNDISLTACNFYVKSKGESKWTKSGTYMDTIVNYLGCDSIIRIVLRIDTLNNIQLTKNQNSLITNISGAIYKWIDCNNGNKPISNANSQTFNPPISGNYAVIVKVGVCTDTSACININLAEIEDNRISSFTIYPNPTNSIFNISFLKPQRDAIIEVYDNIGTLIYHRTIKDEKYTIDLSNKTNGLYIVRIINGDGMISTRKIIKQ